MFRRPDVSSGTRDDQASAADSAYLFLEPHGDAQPDAKESIYQVCLREFGLEAFKEAISRLPTRSKPASGRCSNHPGLIQYVGRTRCFKCGSKLSHTENVEVLCFIDNSGKAYPAGDMPEWAFDSMREQEGSLGYRYMRKSEHVRDPMRPWCKWFNRRPAEREKIVGGAIEPLGPDHHLDANWKERSSASIERIEFFSISGATAYRTRAQIDRADTVSASKTRKVLWSEMEDDPVLTRAEKRLARAREHHRKVGLPVACNTALMAFAAVVVGTAMTYMSIPAETGMAKPKSKTANQSKPNNWKKKAVDVSIAKGKDKAKGEEDAKLEALHSAIVAAVDSSSTSSGSNPKPPESNPDPPSRDEVQEPLDYGMRKDLYAVYKTYIGTRPNGSPLSIYGMFFAASDALTEGHAHQRVPAPMHQTLAEAARYSDGRPRIYYRVMVTPEDVEYLQNEPDSLVVTIAPHGYTTSFPTRDRRGQDAKKRLPSIEWNIVDEPDVEFNGEGTPSSTRIATYVDTPGQSTNVKEIKIYSDPLRHFQLISEQWGLSLMKFVHDGREQERYVDVSTGVAISDVTKINANAAGAIRLQTNATRRLACVEKSDKYFLVDIDVALAFGAPSTPIINVSDYYKRVSAYVDQALRVYNYPSRVLSSMKVGTSLAILLRFPEFVEAADLLATLGGPVAEHNAMLKVGFVQKTMPPLEDLLAVVVGIGTSLILARPAGYARALLGGMATAALVKTASSIKNAIRNALDPGRVRLWQRGGLSTASLIGYVIERVRSFVVSVAAFARVWGWIGDYLGYHREFEPKVEKGPKANHIAKHTGEDGPLLEWDEAVINGRASSYPVRVNTPCAPVMQLLPSNMVWPAAHTNRENLFSKGLRITGSVSNPGYDEAASPVASMHWQGPPPAPEFSFGYSVCGVLPVPFPAMAVAKSRANVLGAIANRHYVGPDAYDVQTVSQVCELILDVASNSPPGLAWDSAEEVISVSSKKAKMRDAFVKLYDTRSLAEAWVQYPDDVDFFDATASLAIRLDPRGIALTTAFLKHEARACGKMTHPNELFAPFAGRLIQYLSDVHCAIGLSSSRACFKKAKEAFRMRARMAGIDLRIAAGMNAVQIGSIVVKPNTRPDSIVSASDLSCFDSRVLGRFMRVVAESLELFGAPHSVTSLFLNDMANREVRGRIDGATFSIKAISDSLHSGSPITSYTSNVINSACIIVATERFGMTVTPPQDLRGVVMGDDLYIVSDLWSERCARHYTEVLCQVYREVGMRPEANVGTVATTDFCSAVFIPVMIGDERCGALVPKVGTLLSKYGASVTHLSKQGDVEKLLSETAQGLYPTCQAHPILKALLGRTLEIVGKAGIKPKDIPDWVISYEERAYTSPDVHEFIERRYDLDRHQIMEFCEFLRKIPGFPVAIDHPTLRTFGSVDIGLSLSQMTVSGDGSIIGPKPEEKIGLNVASIFDEKSLTLSVGPLIEEAIKFAARTVLARTFKAPGVLAGMFFGLIEMIMLRRGFSPRNLAPLIMHTGLGLLGFRQSYALHSIYNALALNSQNQRLTSKPCAAWKSLAAAVLMNLAYHFPTTTLALGPVWGLYQRYVSGRWDPDSLSAGSLLSAFFNKMHQQHPYLVPIPPGRVVLEGGDLASRAIPAFFSVFGPALKDETGFPHMPAKKIVEKVVKVKAPKRASRSGKKTSKRKEKKPRNKSRVPSGIPASRARVGAPRAQSGRATIMRSADSTRIIHTEMFDEVGDSASFNPIQYVINPSSGTMFPWLSGQTRGWESYRFNRLSFDFRTVVGTNYNGAFDAAVIYDPDIAAAPADIVSMQANEDKQYMALHENCTLRCNPKNLHKMAKYWLPNPGDKSNVESRTELVGSLFLALTGAATTPSVVRCFVSYDVTLSTQLPPNSNGESASLVADIEPDYIKPQANGSGDLVVPVLATETVVNNAETVVTGEDFDAQFTTASPADGTPIGPAYTAAVHVQSPTDTTLDGITYIQLSTADLLNNTTNNAQALVIDAIGDVVHTADAVVNNIIDGASAVETVFDLAADVFTGVGPWDIIPFLAFFGSDLSPADVSELGASGCDMRVDSGRFSATASSMRVSRENAREAGGYRNRDFGGLIVGAVSMTSSAIFGTAPVYTHVGSRKNYRGRLSVAGNVLTHYCPPGPYWYTVQVAGTAITALTVGSAVNNTLGSQSTVINAAATAAKLVFSTYATTPIDAAINFTFACTATTVTGTSIVLAPYTAYLYTGEFADFADTASVVVPEPVSVARSTPQRAVKRRNAIGHGKVAPSKL